MRAYRSGVHALRHCIECSIVHQEGFFLVREGAF
jgi:hypothetical protein